jgi:DNA-binding PadR family transcriptional regulator
MLLESLFGSKNRERILIFLHAREDGYAREIARFFDTDYYPIYAQLGKLEADGVIVSHKVGRTIVFQFNPRYALLPELRALLEKALTFYPEELQEQLLLNRRRPRRRGKPN